MCTLEYEASAADLVCCDQRDRDFDTARRHGNEQVSVCELPELERTRPHWGAALTAVLLSLCLSSASQAQSVTPSQPEGELPTLTTARQAHSLTSEEAKRGYPVHLRGVVTYFDPDYGTGLAAIFIHDDTGSIFVSQTSKLAAPLFAGALVDVRGVTKPGGFGPVVWLPQIHILGRAPLPPNPPRVSLALLKAGAYDAQWVEVEGSVHRVTEYPHAVVLNLELPDGPLPVLLIRDPGETYSNLVDAQVIIHANAAPTMNTDGQMIGVHLQGPNLSALQVIEPAPSNPFASPPIPIEGLLQWEHFSTPMHRVHLRGNVTLHWPGSMLCIRDATRGICAQTTQATPVTVGDLVDVAGFVVTDDNAPVITDAVFQIAGTNSPVTPRPAIANKILDGGFSSELIQIDGRLIGYDLTSSDAILQLSSGDALFPVILPKSLVGSEANDWKVGSRLRVTGICSVRIVDVQSNVRAGVATTKSFRVLMRSPADVTILERPSWWTPAHAMIVLGLVLTATLFVLVWVVILRRRIEQQAELLRESEEIFRHMALHDALTGLATRLLLQDRLKVALDGARRRRTGLAVLMVDLDRFKGINDTYGHQAGDDVLRVTATRLLGVVRKVDTVARLGGDEFVVLLPDLADPQSAVKIAATIVETLAVPIPFEGLEIPVSTSVGVCAAAADKFDVDAFMRNADAALYRAKDSGRNCLQVFAVEQDESLLEKELE
ncbi:MAG: diguanylate cyclase domain-containing protein [Terracidiphilus sp.]